MTSNDSDGQWKKKTCCLTCFNSNYGWICIVSAPDCELIKIYTSFSLTLAKSGVWVKPDVQVQPHHGHYAHRPLAYDTLPSCQRHGHSCQEDAIPKSSIEAFVVCLYIWIHFCQPAGGDFQKSVIICNYVLNICDHLSNSVMKILLTMHNAVEVT